ncbi:hypothetical protein Vretifemale_16893, partial [Volvox reticuliferus]
AAVVVAAVPAFGTVVVVVVDAAAVVVVAAVAAVVAAVVVAAAAAEATAGNARHSVTNAVIVTVEAGPGAWVTAAATWTTEVLRGGLPSVRTRPGFPSAHLPSPPQ